LEFQAEWGQNAATDIAEEFTHRPWHQNIRCEWDGSVLILQAENDWDKEGKALLDEFSDAISACIAEPFNGLHSGEGDHGLTRMTAPKMKSAQQWIEHLNLQPHPEGGYYRQTYSAALILQRAALLDHGGDRAASTAIYFLLAGDQFSALHRLRSDEVWHFYAGSALIVHVIAPDGDYQQLLLGSDAAAGDQFQAVVPAGSWFGSSLCKPNTYALVGCTVAPGFDFADFEMANRDELAAQYPQHRAIIERLTRDRETASS
jgi:predicted cupin superfamily sugar epimerase